MQEPSHRNILIYRIGQLGDTIVALPALWALRQHFPLAHLALLSDRHCESSLVAASQVLPAKRLVDEFLFYEANTTGASWRRLVKQIPALRRRRFDTLAYLAPRFRAPKQLWRDLGFFRLAGISNFIGYRGTTVYNRPDSGRPLPVWDREADHLLSRLARSGIPVPPPGKGCMDLLLSDRETIAAEKWIKTRGGEGQGRIFIGLGVGSKYPAKIWSADRFAGLGHYLIQELGAFPMIFGGLEDRPLGDFLLDQWGVGANAAGELNVRQAAAALSFCRLFIGNDTGTMHLAAAVGTPCVAIFSARDWPGRWYPYGEGHVVLRKPVPCEGCMRFRCEDKDSECLKQITVEEVREAAWRVFKQQTDAAGKVGNYLETSPRRK